jgi:hypothetical protein
MREDTHMQATSEHPAPSHSGHGGHSGHSGHSWLMIACCIPMLGIGGLLVVTGVVNPSFLLYAVACTAMMALMMRGMHHGGNRGSDGHHAAPPAPPAPLEKRGQGDR